MWEVKLAPETPGNGMSARAELKAASHMSILWILPDIV